MPASIVKTATQATNSNCSATLAKLSIAFVSIFARLACQRHHRGEVVKVPDPWRGIGVKANSTSATSLLLHCLAYGTEEASTGGFKEEASTGGFKEDASTGGFKSVVPHHAACR